MLTVGGLVLAGGLLVAAPASAAVPSPVCDPSGCTVTLGYTGQVEQWTVPADAADVTIEIAGAGGSPHFNGVASGGAFETGATGLAPGATLAIVVGQQGQVSGVGGYGGGGDGGALNGAAFQGAGGGGASYVFTGSGATWPLFAAAGGGGGSAGVSIGSVGGGANANGAGPSASNSGGGGTVIAGGTGGVTSPFPASLTAGTAGGGPASYDGIVFTPGAGGVGGASATSGGPSNGSGGGGGGGYFGGGGGAGGIGLGFTGYQGGGGSGYLVSGVSSTPLAANLVDGRVAIRYHLESPSTVLTTSPASGSVGVPMVLTVHVSCAEDPTGALTFSSGGTVLGATAVNASGLATLAFTPTAPSTSPLTVDYAGNGLCSASTTSMGFTVAPLPRLAATGTSDAGPALLGAAFLLFGTSLVGAGLFLGRRRMTN
jgi:hypothetical protein